MQRTDWLDLHHLFLFIFFFWGIILIRRAFKDGLKLEISILFIGKPSKAFYIYFSPY